MTDTVVPYHRDGFREGRPAVNVKVRGFDRAAYDLLEAALDDNQGGYANETESLYREAEREVFEQFWTDAAEKAAELGLGPVAQEGRSGGWLVLTDGRDPHHMGELPGQDPRDGGSVERYEWLAAYRALSDWCAERVAAAPAEIAHLAREQAIEIVAHRSVTLRSWLAFGREGAL